MKRFDFAENLSIIRPEYGWYILTVFVLGVQSCPSFSPSSPSCHRIGLHHSASHRSSWCYLFPKSLYTMLLSISLQKKASFITSLPLLKSLKSLFIAWKIESPKWVVATWNDYGCPLFISFFSELLKPVSSSHSESLIVHNNLSFTCGKRMSFLNWRVSITLKKKIFFFSRV